jgi:hypothetical protein
VAPADAHLAPLAFNPVDEGTDLWFDNTYAGFNGIGGLDTVPLLGFVHPRHRAHLAGILSPVLILRDPSATKVECILGDSTTLTVTRTVEPDPVTGFVPTGFIHCGEFDLDWVSSVVPLVARVTTIGDYGELQYEARIVIEHN